MVKNQLYKNACNNVHDDHVGETPPRRMYQPL